MFAAVLSPARLSGSAESLAAFFGADVAPSRCPKAHSLPIQRGRSEFSARDVQQFQRKVQNDLHRQPTLFEDSPERHRSSDAEAIGKF